MAQQKLDRAVRFISRWNLTNLNTKYFHLKQSVCATWCAILIWQCHAKHSLPIQFIRKKKHFWNIRGATIANKLIHECASRVLVNAPLTKFPFLLSQMQLQSVLSIFAVKYSCVRDSGRLGLGRAWLLAKFGCCRYCWQWTGKFICRFTSLFT